MTDYDLIVVGAGPAGSMAARKAAKFGLSVLVLEQKKVVGYPSHCAGGILTNILDNMNLISIVKPSICSQIQKVRTISPFGEAFTHEFGEKIGYIVDRPTFDQLLIKDAQRKGAELFTQARVIGLKKTDNHFNQVLIKQNDKISTLTTKLIIGADGVSSNIAQWTGLKVPHNYIGIGHGYNANNVANLSPDTIEIYFIETIPGGYAWIFPRGDESANIGVGGYNTGIYVKKIFNWFKNYHPVASLMLKNAHLTSYTGGIVPGSKLPNKSTFNFGMIVGDACNHVEPLSGEGIRLALHCGDLAGHIAALAVQHDDLSKVHIYHYHMQKKTSLELTLGYYIRYFLIRANASDYDTFIKAISKLDLNSILDKRKWIPFLLKALVKTPSALKILRTAFSSPPPSIKTHKKN